MSILQPGQGLTCSSSFHNLLLVTVSLSALLGFPLFHPFHHRSSFLWHASAALAPRPRSCDVLGDTDPARGTVPRLLRIRADAVAEILCAIRDRRGTQDAVHAAVDGGHARVVAPLAGLTGQASSQIGRTRKGENLLELILVHQVHLDLRWTCAHADTAFGWILVLFLDICLYILYIYIVLLYIVISWNAMTWGQPAAIHLV